jgi:creatinase
MERPDFFTLHNGNKAKLPFSEAEYQKRLNVLRTVMSKNNLDMIILTSIHNIAYYTGFIYCSFGRPYGCIVTNNKVSTISANIDASQPWRRSHCDNIIFTDWKRDNFLKAIVSFIGRDEPPKKIGIENDHITLEIKEKLSSIFTFSIFSDVSKNLMQLRMIKSAEEIEVIKNGARIADIGGVEIVKNIGVGESELEIAIAGRDKMEREIAKTYPDAEYMDTWVWFQSGINTDGAHNPKTSRKLVSGDILSLNTFPMISGYYTALERTLFVDHVDEASLKAWEANIKVHKRGLELIKPGAKCSEICHELNELFAELGYLHYRTFGYGHSFGVLSHFYGRESGLELREDIDTVLEENMVVSMEPMIMIPEGNPGAGGYREHDIIVIGKDKTENITKFPFGPENNIIKKNT